MATILDMLENLESLDLRNEVPKIIKKLGPEMIDYNLSQLKKGETSQGRAITPRYSSVEYAELKYSLSPLAGYRTPDLNLTGDFYAGFKVDFNALDYFFYSTDSKSGDLSARYSKNGDIFGLQDLNKAKLAQDDVLPEIDSLIQEKTGLKLS